MVHQTYDNKLHLVKKKHLIMEIAFSFLYACLYLTAFMTFLCTDSTYGMRKAFNTVDNLIRYMPVLRNSGFYYSPKY